MTRVTFHHGVPEPLDYTCRLVRKAVQAGQRVWLLGEAPVLAQLDARLWQMAPTDFIPHCTSDAAPGFLQRSAVVLASDAAPPPDASARVLVNLLPNVAAQVQRYTRVIEIVGADEPSVHAGRARWRQYAALGCTLDRHDAGASGARGADARK